MSDHYLGIDWGTHSSKWCYQSQAKPIVGPIWDSRVWREATSLCAFPLERRHEGSQGEVGLKRKLIQDPDQPFWEGERPRLGVTLGEATTFSLLALLEDAYKTLRGRGINLKKAQNLTVRFSHPNWITPHNLPALKSYRDSAVVALSIFVSESPGDMTEKAYCISVETLRKSVLSHKRCIDKLEPFPAEYSYKGYRDVLKGQTGDATWEFVFESCAAGFPYLLEVESEVYEKGFRPPRQRTEKWIGRKILVVDIGAGSTDAGYMLRTFRPEVREPMLIWLPPADALELAGNWLTDRIQQQYVREGKPRTTWVEAEIHKTTRKDWYGRPFVDEWCSRITEHVADYVRQIPDTRRLPDQPPLEIVLTGGSSSVQPIRESIVKMVQEALRDRGICSKRLVDSTILLNATIKSARLSEADSARYAVCVGASSARMVELTHYPEGLS